MLDVLRSADVILAEDTRVTRKLLARYDIHTALERYDEATAAVRTPVIVDRIADGAVVALVSDAGTPGISDPGARLVDATLNAMLPVEVLPGASAITTALVASGLPTHAFYFGGFLPRKAGELRRTLSGLSGLDATLIFYESPRRTAASLAAIAEVLPGAPGCHGAGTHKASRGSRAWDDRGPLGRPCGSRTQGGGRAAGGSARGGRGFQRE